MLLALDGSLCATGWCVAPLPNSPISELLVGCITTEKADAKRRLYQAEDDAQRGRKIAMALRDLKAADPGTQVICEQPAGSKSARGAAAIKLAQGVILGVLGDKEARWVLAIEAKVALCGKKKSDKNRMVAEAERRGLKMMGNKLEREAQADAFAVLCASGLWRPS